MPSERKLTLHLSIGGIGRALAFWIGLLTAANLVAITLQYGLAIESNSGYRRLFLFNAEANIPTFYQAVALLACGIVLSWVAQAKVRSGDPFRLHWLGLAFIFLFLAIDEAAEIHELATGPARLFVEATGVFRLTWVAVALPALAVLLIAYWRFLFHLSLAYRVAFMACGACFVGGAVAVEMLSGAYLDGVGEYDGGYALITTVEELLEKIGVAAFLVTLLRYVRDDARAVHLVLH